MHRLPKVSVEIERAVYRYIEQVCRDEKCDVLAVGGMPDHIHLLVALSSTVSLSDLMKNVKGGSSRLISQTLKPGEWFEWQKSYGAFSIAVRDKTKVVEYIENQKAHHDANTTLPHAEETFEIIETTE